MSVPVLLSVNVLWPAQRRHYIDLEIFLGVIEAAAPSRFGEHFCLFLSR